MFTYEYPRPAITVDILVFRIYPKWEVLLIKRNQEPFKDCWAFPGGFVESNELLEDAAKRELKEETGLKVSKLHFIFISDAIDRDPRERIISNVYSCILEDGVLNDLKASDDAKELKWFSLAEIDTIDIAFDHLFIYKKVFEIICGDGYKNSYKPYKSWRLY